MSVELPSRVYKKDRIFHQGIFVASNVAWEKGKPLFGKVDPDKVLALKTGRRCQLCGQRIAKDQFCVFPGGFDEYHYIEAPLHMECARYAMQVCPHILRKRDSFGFSVCKKYIYDSMTDLCFPDFGGMRSLDILILSMAHSRELERIEERGKIVGRCTDCGGTNMGKMNYNEFMKWSAL